MLSPVNKKIYAQNAAAKVKVQKQLQATTMPVFGKSRGSVPLSNKTRNHYNATTTPIRNRSPAASSSHAANLDLPNLP